MPRISRILSSTFLSATLIVSVAAAGCAARVRVYDQYHSDYHHWDHDEDRVYRQYWVGRNQPYRGYSRLNKDEQKEYWDWRHSH